MKRPDRVEWVMTGLSTHDSDQSRANFVNTGDKFQHGDIP